MRKNYQNQEIDTSQLAVPDTVSVALTELAGEIREGLLALAVGTGLQVMGTGRDRSVRAEGPPRHQTDGDTPWSRRGVGDPGRAPAPGRAAADARHRRLR